MKQKIKISVAIVLYREDIYTLKKTINCVLKTPLSKKIFLIDNTPNSVFKGKFDDKNIIYIPIGKNIGFGAGHNIVIDKIKDNSEYHLILNPDVSFSLQTIPNLIKQIEKDESVSMIAPKVLFPNGDYQKSCRRYPNLLELFVRRVRFIKPILNSIVEKGAYSDRNLSIPFFAEYLTGCFQLYKTEDFVKLKGFDERYFLYMEDVDICRKIDKMGKKKRYYPQEEIYHILKKESERNIKLFLHHTISIFKYFNKWGF